MDIALHFSNFFQCKQLAVELELERGMNEAEVARSQCHGNIWHIATNLLQKWKEEKGREASGVALYKVLQKIGLTQVAHAFERQLTFSGGQ